ncbi:hypothetical protein, partial [Streptomyces chattanoogensis]|uniref:hypothetical protein n=1 Tax=Streptomyces chattanoogensis TaxID=66876 RepID=UPI00367F1BF7
RCRTAPRSGNQPAAGATARKPDTSAQAKRSGVHPAYMLAQMGRARALGRQRLWEEALTPVRDALSYRERAELDRDRPRDAALLRLAHAEVMTAAVRSLREEGASRSRGVGMFPAPVVRFLDRTVGTNSRPEKIAWDEARALAETAARACDAAFGPAHPHALAARALLEQPGPQSLADGPVTAGPADPLVTGCPAPGAPTRRPRLPTPVPTAPSGGG